MANQETMGLMTYFHAHPCLAKHE